MVKNRNGNIQFRTIKLITDNKTTKMTFKEGDKVRIIKNCSGTILGEVYTLVYVNSDIAGCSCQHNWELVGSQNNIITKMKTLKSLAKRLLDKDLQTLYQVEYINGEGLELTEKGKNALLALLFVEKKAELVKEAQEELDESKN